MPSFTLPVCWRGSVCLNLSTPGLGLTVSGTGSMEPCVAVTGASRPWAAPRSASWKHHAEQWCGWQATGSKAKGREAHWGGGQLRAAEPAEERRQEAREVAEASSSEPGEGPARGVNTRGRVTKARRLCCPRHQQQQHLLSTCRVTSSVLRP